MNTRFVKSRSGKCGYQSSAHWVMMKEIGTFGFRERMTAWITPGCVTGKRQPTWSTYLLGLLCSSLYIENMYLHGTVSKEVYLRHVLNFIKKSEVRFHQYDNILVNSTLWFMMLRVNEEFLIRNGETVCYFVGCALWKWNVGSCGEMRLVIN